MSKNQWTKWTKEAIEQACDGRAPEYWEMPQSAIMNQNPYKPRNWYPRNAISRIVTSNDPRDEMLEVVRDTMVKFMDYAGRQDLELPPGYHPDNARWVFAESYALSGMLVKGSLGELLAADHLRAKGAHIMSDEVTQRFASFDGDIDENHGIDLVIVWEDGSVETIQVKSSTGEAGKYSGDADTILIADAESQEVKEY